MKSWDSLLAKWISITSIFSQQKRVFNPTNSNAIISKPKKLFWLFFCFSGIYIKFWILSKESWAWEIISFWNYWLEKGELLKCPKSHCVRTLMDSQHFKGSETLLKSARESRIISEPERVFSFFFCISEIYINFWILLKKKLSLRCRFFLKLLTGKSGVT